MVSADAFGDVVPLADRDLLHVGEEGGDVFFGEEHLPMEVGAVDRVLVDEPQRDARLGESSAENLAAFWDTATTTITFFCDPGDGETSDRSVLAITYGPRLDQ